VDRGYDYFEHTADVGIRAWGPTLEDAFAQAALGLVANVVDLSQAKAVGEARLVVEGESRERLLFRLLDEVLDLLQTRLYVPTRIAARFEGPTRLVADVEGEAYDAARHGHVHEVKAITFHGMEIRETPGRAEVRVIVDI
jgi:SHS2 domain-containing protein